MALLAGIPPVDIVLLIVADVGMIGTGLIAALNEAAPIKWGLYFISNLFFVYVVSFIVLLFCVFFPFRPFSPLPFLFFPFRFCESADSHVQYVIQLYGLIITGRKSANIRGDGVATV